MERGIPRLVLSDPASNNQGTGALCCACAKARAEVSPQPRDTVRKCKALTRGPESTVLFLSFFETLQRFYCKVISSYRQRDRLVASSEGREEV